MATLLLYVAVALSLSMRTPAWENNDEQDHVRYAEYIMRHHALPSIGGANGIESVQPPLYYLTLAVWQKELGIHAFTPSLSPPEGPPVDILDRVNVGSHDYTPEQLANARSLHQLRLLNVAFGAVTVAASLLFSLLLTGQVPVAVAVGATVGLWPKFDVVSAAVTNDGMVDALAACAVLFLLLSLRSPRRTLWSAATGIALGGAVLTKFTALPIAGLAFASIVAVGVHRRDWRGPLVAVLTFAAVSGWWFAQNTVLYGDPLAHAASKTYLATALPGLVWPVSGLGLQQLTFGRDTLLKSVWYDGSFNQLILPLAVNIGVTALAAVALIRGAAICGRRLFGQNQRLLSWTLVLIPILGSIVAWLLILRDTTQAEGRYLLVGVTGWALLLCAGTDRTFRRSRAARCALLSIWPLLFLAIDVFVFARYEIPYGGT